MVYVVSYKEGIIGQTKSEQVVLQVEGGCAVSTSLINSRPSNDMRINHRYIERRHEDIFIRYRNEAFMHTH